MLKKLKYSIIYGNSMFKFTKKSSNTKRVLKLWVKSWEKNDRAHKNQVDRLQVLNLNLQSDRDNLDTQREIVVCKNSTEQLLKVEEEDVRQKNKAYCWLILGGRNTKFFSIMTKERKSTNSIYKLIGEGGKAMP